MRMRWRWLAGGAALVLLGMDGPDARGQAYLETFEGKAPEAMLGGVLVLGQEGPWRAALEDGVYILEHWGEPGAIRYYWLGEVPGQAGAAPAEEPVAVDIGGEFADDFSGAGLIFRFDPAQRFYYGFALLKGGRYGVLQRDAEGVRLAMTGSSDAIRPSEVNRLSVVPDGVTMRFLINGTEVAAFGNDAVQGPGVGLLAMGSGRFTFDNFAIGRQQSGGAGGDRALAAPPDPAGIEHQDPAGFAIARLP